MKRWALMSGAECVNVVEQDERPDIGGDWLDVTGVAVGPGHRLLGGEWVAPGEAGDRFVTQFAFRTRVTDDIVAQMELAAMHDPSDAPAVQLAKAKRRAAMARCYSAKWLDLDSAELRAGFSGLPAADVARIFDDPVREEERP